MWTVSPRWKFDVQKFYIEKNDNQIRKGIWGNNQKMEKLEALKALAQ
jgi:hypothetical protein